MASRLKGITLEIGGNVTGLDKALRDVNSSISDTQKKLKDVERLLKLDPGNTELLAQKQRLLRDAVDETKEKLNQLKEADKTAKDQLDSGDLGQDQYDALQREIAETEQKLKDLQKEQKNFGSVIGQELQAAGDKISGVGDKISGAGEKMTKSVTLPIVGIGTAVVKTAADFEAQMSKVSAISGATGGDLETLEAKAREMGEKTKFSATEAAEAFEYMAMAGWKTEDMVSGIDGILNLAAAAGTDLATTSDIVTDALTGFGLAAEDAGHFADIMAAASSNANTNVEMMGETFKYVAPVAGAMGYRAEDVSVAIGLMANSGIKASQAGTALRTLLTNMAKPTEEMEGAMTRLGISLDDGQGNMKSFREIMDDLRAGFGGLMMSQEEFQERLAGLDAALEDGTLTESNYNKALEGLMDRAYGAEGAVKAANAAALAGKEGMSGLLAIVNASEEDYNKLSEAIANCTYNLDDITGAMEDSGVKWSKYADEAWMTTGDGIRGLTDEIIYNLQDVGASAEDLQEYLQMEYGLDADDALAAIQTVQDNAKGAAESMADTMQDNLEGQIQILISQLQELALSLAETLMPIVKDVVGHIQNLVDWFNNLSPATQDMIVKIGLIAALVGPLLVGVGKVISTVGGIVGGIGKVTSVIGGLTSAGGAVAPMLGGIAAAAGPLLIGGAVIAGIVAGVVLIVKHWDEIKEAAGKVKDDVTENWAYMKESISETASNIGEVVSGKWAEIKQKTSDSWNGIKSDMSENWQYMKESISGTASEIKEAISGKWNEIKQKTSDTWDSIKSHADERWDGMKKTALVVGLEIFNAVSDKFSAIHDKITEKIGAARDFVWSAIEAIKGFFHFEWKLPDLKLPHIVVGEYIDVPVLGRIPNPAKLSVEWYKKAMDDPRILKGASIFGYSNGKLLGGGEAGEEVVSGKETLLNLIKKAVASVQMVRNMDLTGSMREALQAANVTVTYGDVHMNVYGAEGQNVNELAEVVSRRLKNDYEREKAVWK